MTVSTLSQNREWILASTKEVVRKIENDAWICVNPQSDKLHGLFVNLPNIEKDAQEGQKRISLNGLFESWQRRFYLIANTYLEVPEEYVSTEQLKNLLSRLAPQWIAASNVNKRKIHRVIQVVQAVINRTAGIVQSSENHSCSTVAKPVVHAVTGMKFTITYLYSEGSNSVFVPCVNGMPLKVNGQIQLWDNPQIIKLKVYGQWLKIKLFDSKMEEQMIKALQTRLSQLNVTTLSTICSYAPLYEILYVAKTALESSENVALECHTTLFEVA